MRVERSILFFLSYFGFICTKSKIKYIFATLFNLKLLKMVSGGKRVGAGRKPANKVHATFNLKRQTIASIAELSDELQIDKGSVVDEAVSVLHKKIKKE